MSHTEFVTKIRQKMFEEMPQPFTSRTAERLIKLFEVGREDLSLAKICEAHWDALAILSEANKPIHPDALYGVWASEIPGMHLQLKKKSKDYFLSGKKMFCSGAGLVDRALITAYSSHSVLLDIDLKSNQKNIHITKDLWYTNAFQLTNTASVTFDNFLLDSSSIIENGNWYIERSGFWTGALGPAACWAGGAAGLLDYAQKNKRNDAHTLSHLGAMSANIWTMKSLLMTAGDTVDAQKWENLFLHELALMVRHQIEQLSTDTIRRFARAYGPFPLACDENISRRYQELDLYLRQNHAERDLESLGVLILQQAFPEKIS
jgi:hypothetical protein